jgi:hypothetical protein
MGQLTQAPAVHFLLQHSEKLAQGAPPLPQPHWALELQVSGAVQVPQLPPQPSGPHFFPMQLGTQAEH